MSTAELKLWDRENCCPGEPMPSVHTDDVKLVRQRFWNDKNNNKVEGCVVEMVEDYDGPSEFGLANVASEARRALDVIEAEPEGTDAVRTNPEPAEEDGGDFSYSG